MGITLNETFANGLPGSRITGRQAQPRLLTVSGYLLGDVEECRRQLLACVAPGITARLTLQPGDGGSYYLSGEPIVTPEITDGRGMQNFQFQFKCPYPYWKTTESTRHSFRSLQNLFRFPHQTGGRWFISRYQDNVQINARNEGNIPVGATLYFTALKDSTGPLRLSNLTTGEYLEIIYPMAAGDRFEICTEAGGRYATSYEKGTPKNGYYRVAYGSSLKFSLAPGDNQIVFTNKEGAGAMQIALHAPKGVLAGV